MKKIITVVLAAVLFTACNSVFSGGAGGVIVDAESTSVPKQGIANVDVYAYTDAAARDADAAAWKDGTVFKPGASYYGHTLTGNDGKFSISKLVWEKNPAETKFGKDADVAQIYLIFYHEKYGLTKGQTLIVSDTFSDTVYAELMAVRKTTALNLSFEDVSTGNNSGVPLYVKVSVPQTSSANTSAAPKIYEAVITGTGVINISYPRWQNSSDKSVGKETEPQVSIQYYQSGDEENWRACHNCEVETDVTGYPFYSESEGVVRTIKNPSYNITLYGKPTKLSIPSVSGQFVGSGDAKDDGLIVSMKAKGSGTNFDIDCGEVTTYSQTKGSTSDEKHGLFSGLGNGITWKDSKYTGKYAETEVEIYVSGTSKKVMQVKSNNSSYNVQL